MTLSIQTCNCSNILTLYSLHFFIKHVLLFHITHCFLFFCFFFSLLTLFNYLVFVLIAEALRAGMVITSPWVLETSSYNWVLRGTRSPQFIGYASVLQANAHDLQVEGDSKVIIDTLQGQSIDLKFLGEFQPLLMILSCWKQLFTTLSSTIQFERAIYMHAS